MALKKAHILLIKIIRILMLKNDKLLYVVVLYLFIHILMTPLQLKADPPDINAESRPPNLFVILFLINLQ